MSKKKFEQDTTYNNNAYALQKDIPIDDYEQNKKEHISQVKVKIYK